MQNCGAIAVTASMTYMTIVELFDEYPSPFSPEMTMILIDHDTNIYLYIENRKKHQSLLLRGLGSGQVHHLIHHHHLAFFIDLVIKIPNTHTPGLRCKTRSYTVKFTLNSSISVTSRWLHITRALSNKKQQIL